MWRTFVQTKLRTKRQGFFARASGSAFRKLASDAKGTTAVVFALSLPAIMAVVGVAADFGFYNMKRTKMQAAADQAAIAAAQELTLSQFTAKSVLAAADGSARAYLNEATADLQIDAKIEDSNKKVRVTIAETWTPFFAHFLGADITPIKVHASAALFGEAKICVLALTPSEIGAISMTKNSHMRADDCTVYSNSSSSSSMFLGDTSSVDAKLVCTVGGVKDNGSLSADKVVTDCPVLKDPLASRQPPTVGSCDRTGFTATSGTIAIQPWCLLRRYEYFWKRRCQRFCRGNTSSRTALCWSPAMQPSRAKTWAFSLQALWVSCISGANAMIDLAGREKGPMAGMLFFDDPKQLGLLRLHSVSAARAVNLTGTIYLPNGSLIVDPAAKVGEASAYTAIVAKRLVVQNGPTLVLNTNYKQTPVPVPEGIRAAADIHLVD